jgi:hypothetical protein
MGGGGLPTLLAGRNHRDLELCVEPRLLLGRNKARSVEIQGWQKIPAYRVIPLLIGHLRSSIDTLGLEPIEITRHLKFYRFHDGVHRDMSVQV